MEPVPETTEALRELALHDDPTVARMLWWANWEVQRLVPEVVALSLTCAPEDLTFTLAATQGPVAVAHTPQNVAGNGGTTHGRHRASNTDRAAEQARQPGNARATTPGVASTLALPIRRHGRVVAQVHLYAATADAFAGRDEQLAMAFDARDDELARDADPAFTTRAQATHTPDRIRDGRLVDQAIGALMSHTDLAPLEVEDRLLRAARHASLSDAQLASAILDLLRSAGEH